MPQCPNYQDNEVQRESIAFWSESSSWPTSTPNLVFLAPALDFLGKAYYGREWSDFEFLELVLPRFEDGQEYEIQPESHTEWYLKRFAHICYSEYGEQIDSLVAYSILGAPHREASYERAQSIISIFVSACLRGEIQTFGQKIGGGVPFEPIAEYEWSSENAREWLLFCHQGNELLPPSVLKRTQSRETLPKAIFVERESLRGFRSNFPIFQQTPDHSHFIQLTPVTPVNRAAEIQATKLANKTAPTTSRIARSECADERIDAVVEASIKFFAKHGYRCWADREADDELRNILGTSRSQWKAWLEKSPHEIKVLFPRKTGPRGPRSPNRIKELKEFRDFFASGKMGN